MKDRVFALLFALLLILTGVGCKSKNEPVVPTPTPQETQPAASTPAPVVSGTPKYIFFFIGDGMGAAHVQLAALLDSASRPDYAVTPVRFAQFPVLGNAQTYLANTYVPDSAASGTGLACGVKTVLYTVGLEADRKTIAPNLTEYYHEKGYKTGVISSVAINNATPATFYAHTSTRSNYHEIGQQMARGTVDFFGGGGITSETQNGESVLKLLKRAGYTVADTIDQINALNNASGKVYAMDPNATNNIMDYEIEKKEGALTLADYVRKGIDVLYTENGPGFFMMCESGKIDLAAHNNDAVGVISEVKALDNAVAQAYEFYLQHPNETLIIVTADHETGGLTLGTTNTGYALYPKYLLGQTTSGSTADTAVKAIGKSMMEDQLKDLIRTHYGFNAPGTSGGSVTLTNKEWAAVQKAYRVYTGKENISEDEKFELYDTYNPIVQACNTIISARTGLGWSSHEHTGVPVPVYAIGAGAERFSGAMDNIDINKNLKF